MFENFSHLIDSLISLQSEFKKLIISLISLPFKREILKIAFSDKLPLVIILSFDKISLSINVLIKRVTSCLKKFKGTSILFLNSFRENFVKKF